MVYVKYFELKTLKNQSLAFSIVVWKRQNKAPEDADFTRRTPLSSIGFWSPFNRFSSKTSLIKNIRLTEISKLASSNFHFYLRRSDSHLRIIQRPDGMRGVERCEKSYKEMRTSESVCVCMPLDSHEVVF